MKFVRIKTECTPGAAPQDTLLNVETIVKIYKYYKGGYWVVVNNGGFQVDDQDAEKIFSAIGGRL